MIKGQWKEYSIMKTYFALQSNNSLNPSRAGVSKVQAFATVPM